MGLVLLLTTTLPLEPSNNFSLGRSRGSRQRLWEGSPATICTRSDETATTPLCVCFEFYSRLVRMAAGKTSSQPEFRSIEVLTHQKFGVPSVWSPTPFYRREFSTSTIPSILPRAFLLLDSHLFGAGFATSQVAQAALISLGGLQNNWMALQVE
ncbi:hypothetical protein EDD85DRAFT_523001 [Armillaria nabsnona]|nr:hypothetical protein EDD85DRAFT_523001 [Armillaria nabsnona]